MQNFDLLSRRCTLGLVQENWHPLIRLSRNMNDIHTEVLRKKLVRIPELAIIRKDCFKGLLEQPVSAVGQIRGNLGDD